jgi:signal transduction histidine kinase
VSERGQLLEARAEVGKQGAQIATMERAHRRLELLYAVSKLLTRFRTVDETVPEVIALVAEELALRSAIVLLETEGGPQAMVWQVVEGDDVGLEAAKRHAQLTYGMLVSTSADQTLDRAPTRTLLRRPSTSAQAVAPISPRFFLLPLVVPHGPIFGAIQFEDGTAIDEEGLGFANAVTNQLAIAVDRQAAIVQRQATAEAREREQRLLAQVGEVVAASLSPGATLAAIARCAVPLFADLCLVDEVDENGIVRRLDVMFADAAQQQALAERMKRFSPRPGWTTPQAQVLQTGKPLLFAEIADPVAAGIAQDDEHGEVLRSSGIRSEIVLPLLARGRKLGALTFSLTGSDRHYTEHDLALATEIALRAATSIDNARLYEQAQLAIKSRENLLAVVSHDLGNALNVITLNLDVVLHSAASDQWGPALKQLIRVQFGARRMERLIKDLLDTASIEGGQLSVEEDRVDIGPLVAELVDSLATSLAKKRVTLDNQIDGALSPVLADGARLQQVFANLLGNALKFTPPGGTITLRAKTTADVATFSVTDTGPGIAAADLPYLFERLWQAKSTAKLGTGLGLFIVKGIVESHGGRVWAESVVGEGTTFSFTLKIAHQTGRPPPS